MFQALTGIRRLLGSLMSMSILEEFNGVLAAPISRQPSPEAVWGASSSSAFDGPAMEGVQALGSGKEWESLMDADLLLGGSQTSLKRELFTRMLVPQVWLCGRC